MQISISMFSWILTCLSLIALILLSLKHIRYGVYWTIVMLPFYEFGRIHLGPVPTTVVELNVLMLFGWWVANQITNYKLQITNISQTPNPEQKTILVLNVKNWNLFWILDFGFGIFRRLRSEFGTWFWFIVGWLAIATFSTLISPNFREALGVWKAFFVEPILFLVVFVNVIKKEHILSVLNTLIASGSIVAIIAIIQKFTGWWIANPFWAQETTRRVTSVFPFPNAVGLFLAPIVIVTVSLLFERLPAIRKLVSGVKYQVLSIKTCSHNTLYIILYTLASFAMILAVVFAHSRGALLGIGAGILYLAFCHKGKRAYYWSGIGVVVFIVLLSGTLGNIKTYLTRQPVSFSGGNSVSIRTEQWKESIMFLNDHPLLGARVAGYQHALIPYHKNPAVEIYKYPHNVFLNFWTELGLVGLFMFLIIIVYYYSRTARSIKQCLVTSDTWIENNQPIHYSLASLDASWSGLFTIHHCLLASMTALLAHGLFDVPYFKNDLSILFWILIGLSIIITNKTVAATNDS